MHDLIIKIGEQFLNNITIRGAKTFKYLAEF